MASLIHLKRRINASQNVSKTTKAMQMIAASKLKRAQEAALSTRPYVEKLTTLSQGMISKISTENKHPYMEQQIGSSKTLLIILSPDKGLCGGLITNLTREFLRYKKTDEITEYVVIGKKLETRVTHVTNEVLATFSFGTTIPTFDMVYPISSIINEYYLGKKVDKVKILYARYNSIFSQSPQIVNLLPIEIPQTESKQEEQFFLFEPAISDILPELLKHYLEMSLYQFLLESFVSEQGARMIAMQNATNNANDIIEDLKLEYNKTRQAKITGEILDLAGGAHIAHE